MKDEETEERAERHAKQIEISEVWGKRKAEEVIDMEASKRSQTKDPRVAPCKVCPQLA